MSGQSYDSFLYLGDNFIREVRQIPQNISGIMKGCDKHPNQVSEDSLFRKQMRVDKHL